MTLQLHVKISTRHTELKFLQPGIKNPILPYDWHFFQPRMKIWYYAHMNSLFIFIKIKMATSHGSFKLTDDKSYKMFTRIEQFICTFLFLNIGRFQWLFQKQSSGSVLSKKVFVEILQNSQENTCARDSFLIKLQASATLLKKSLWQRCFPVNLAKFLRTHLFYRTPLVAASMIWRIYHLN